MVSAFPSSEEMLLDRVGHWACLSFQPPTSWLSISNHCDSPSLRVSRDHGPFAFLPIQTVHKSRRDLDRDRDTLRSHTLRSQGEPGWTKVDPETLLPRLQHIMAGICTHPCICVYVCVCAYMCRVFQGKGVPGVKCPGCLRGTS